MWRWLKWIVIAPATLAAIAFAVANRKPVAIGFDPMPFAIELPLYAVALAGMFIGFVLGAAGAWWSGRRSRRQARLERRSARHLAARLAQAQGEGKEATAKLPPPSGRSAIVPH